MKIIDIVNQETQNEIGMCIEQIILILNKQGLEHVRVEVTARCKK